MQPIPSSLSMTFNNQGGQSSEDAFACLSSRLKETKSSHSLMDNFEFVIRQYPVRKVVDQGFVEVSDSVSCVKEYSQFPFEFTSDSDSDSEIDPKDVKNRARILIKSIKLEKRQAAQVTKRLHTIETEHMDKIRTWIKRVFELQKKQLALVQKKDQ